MTTYDYVEQPKEMHQQLLDAIRSKNFNKAEKELVIHLEDAKNRALRTLPE
jgi:DNA-binding GntR family transcriptional regulator